jgi:hypothetical protein
MYNPEKEFEYEQKCERIAVDFEMLILDALIAAIGRVNHILHDDDMENRKPSADKEPF